MSASSEDVHPRMSDESVLKMVREEDMLKVMRIVAEHQDNISTCFGKNVIMLLGPTQVGKSVTINALLHGPLIRRKIGPLRYAFDIPETSGVDIVIDDGKKNLCETQNPKSCKRAAKRGDGLTSCTKLPCIYEFEEDSVLLDTRGFFDVTLTPPEEAASSVFLDMIVKKAKTVKIVLLIRCEDYCKGQVGMNALGEVFGKIVMCRDVDRDIPILFILNDYRLDQDDIEQLFGKTPEQRYNYIVTILKNSFRDVEREANNVFESYKSTFSKSIGGCLQGSVEELEEQQARIHKILNSDKKYQDAVDSSRYLHVMSRAIKGEAGGLEYIDPTDDFSIQRVRTALRNLHPVPLDVLTFSNYNRDISEFRDYLAQNLEQFQSFLTASRLLRMYLRPFIEEALRKRIETSENHARVLKELKQGDDVAAKYESVYKVDVFSKQADDLRIELEGLLKQKQQLEENIAEIRGIKEPVLYYSEKWRESSQHPEFILLYEKDKKPEDKIPLASWNREIGEKTEEEIVSEDTKSFEVHYHAGSKGRNIAVNVGHVVAGIGFGLIGVGIYGLIRWAASAVCEGHADFFVKAENLPENAAIIKGKLNEINDIMSQASKLELRMNSLLNAARAGGVKEKVVALKSVVDDEIRELKQFLNFAESFQAICQERFEDARNYYLVISGLYGGKEEFVSFISQGTAVFENSIAPETDIDKIHFSDLDVRQLVVRLQKYFPTFPNLTDETRENDQ